MGVWWSPVVTHTAGLIDLEAEQWPLDGRRGRPAPGSCGRPVGGAERHSDPSGGRFAGRGRRDGRSSVRVRGRRPVTADHSLW